MHVRTDERTHTTIMHETDSRVTPVQQPQIEDQQTNKHSFEFIKRTDCFFFCVEANCNHCSATTSTVLYLVKHATEIAVRLGLEFQKANKELRYR